MAELEPGASAPNETYEGNSEIGTRLRNPAEPLTVRNV